MLLELPAELRDEIWKLCLKFDDVDDELAALQKPKHCTGVIIHRSGRCYGKRLPVPPLLQTCRQLRHDTAAVWFKINRFFISVDNMDARLLHQWMEFCRSVMPTAKKLVKGSDHCPEIHVWNARTSIGRFSWPNLVQWCKWVHEGKLEPLPIEDTAIQRSESLAKGAHLIASYHRGRPWTDCMVSLCGMALALCDILHE